MSIIEHFLKIIAPHVCEGCGAEGQLLCGSCVTSLAPDVAQCYRCRRVNPEGKTCQSCRSQSQLACVRALTTYGGLAKKLIWRLKFQRARTAATEIGILLAPLVLGSASRTVVVHVPTATSRVRKRGYDQAALIARELAGRSGLSYYPLLSRHGQHKQVGANRSRRKAQLEQAFHVRRLQYVRDAHIILVDDVLTTGATLEAAASALKRAGAKKIEAIVFARA